MTDSDVVQHVDNSGYSKEYVDTLKSDMERLQRENAEYHAWKQSQQELTRKQIEQMRPEVKDYMTTISSSNPEDADMIRQWQNWTEKCGTDASNLETDRSLMSFISCCSRMASV